MKVDVIVVYVQRYEKGHELDFVPPLTGIHLAAITPPRHRVRVIHQQLQAIDLGTDADLIALSFFSGFGAQVDRKSTRLNSSHGYISYAVFCLKKKKKK